MAKTTNVPGTLLHIFQPELGGVVEYIRTLFPKFRDAGYHQVIICPEALRNADEFRKMGAELIFMKMVRPIQPINDFKSIRELTRMITEIDPAIIYLHSSKAGAVGRLAAAGLGIPVCYNPHGWAFIMDGGLVKKRFYGLAERVLSRWCDKIVTISDSELSSAVQYGIPVKKLQRIISGIDIKRFKESEKTAYRNRFVIGFAGRLHAAKNPLKVIEIVQNLVAKIPEILALFIGDGELAGSLQTRVSELGLEDQVKFLGWSDAPEDDIRNFDIGLMPSAWEGFGLAVCEYMAAKKPVVVSDAGGLKHIVKHLYDGFVVSSGSTDEYCKYILDLYKSKTLRKDISEAAYKKVCREFTIERVASEHLELFKELQGSSGP